MNSAVEIRNLVVEFPSKAGVVLAIDGLNLTVEQGQVFGFLGPNGAGKTTTIHVLLGFIKAFSGEARILGDDVRHSIARQQIGFLPEHPDTYQFLTGRELLTMAGNLFLMRGKRLKARINDLIELVGLTDAADRYISTYSRGMLQRIGLAQALIHDPDLVILDEPTSGFDPLGRIGVRQIISSLRDRGKTVFFSSHELSEVELICDHIGIIACGRMIAGGRVQDLVKSDESLERYFLRVLS